MIEYERPGKGWKRGIRARIIMPWARFEAHVKFVFKISVKPIRSLSFYSEGNFFIFFISCLILLRNIEQPSILQMEGKRSRSWAVIRHPYFRYNGPSWARSLGIYLFWCHYINLLMQRRREYAKT